MSTKEIKKQPVQNVEQEGNVMPNKPNLSKLKKVQLIEHIEEQYKKIDSLNSIITLKAGEAGDLRRAFMNLENALKRERETVDTLNESIAKLEADLLKSNDNVARLSLDLKTANESYSSLNTLRNHLESKLQSVTSSLDYFRKQSETRQKGNVILSVVIVIMAILWIIF